MVLSVCCFYSVLFLLLFLLLFFFFFFFFLFIVVVGGVVLCMQVCSTYVWLFYAVESTFTFFISGDSSCLVCQTCFVHGGWIDWMEGRFKYRNSIMMYLSFQNVLLNILTPFFIAASVEFMICLLFIFCLDFVRILRLLEKFEKCHHCLWIASIVLGCVPANTLLSPLAFHQSSAFSYFDHFQYRLYKKRMFFLNAFPCT